SERGEIVFRQHDRDYTFRPPAEQLLREPFMPGRQFLGYMNDATKAFVHLTQLPPHRGYVATWARFGRAAVGDKEAEEASLRFTAAARSAQEEIARSLAPDEPARIAEIDAHNE